MDSAGNAYVTGYTESTDFPVTPGAFQTTACGGNCAFVTKLNPTGTALVYSTYLGSKYVYGYGIAVDAAGSAYVTGYAMSTNFPTTPGAIKKVCPNCGPRHGGDAFVTRFNSAGSALFYSTYLGGSGKDYGYGIAVDGAALWSSEQIIGSNACAGSQESLP